jgi:hypothetical protein
MLLEDRSNSYRDGKELFMKLLILLNARYKYRKYRKELFVKLMMPLENKFNDHTDGRELFAKYVMLPLFMVKILRD